MTYINSWKIQFLMILKIHTFLIFEETSNQKKNIIRTSVPSFNSSEGRLHDFMSNAILFFIGSTTTVFIGRAFICFRKRLIFFYHLLILYSYQCWTSYSLTPNKNENSNFVYFRFTRIFINRYQGKEDISFLISNFYMMSNIHRWINNSRNFDLQMTFLVL